MVANEVSRLSGVRKPDVLTFKYVFLICSLCIFAFILLILSVWCCYNGDKRHTLDGVKRHNKSVNKQVTMNNGEYRHGTMKAEPPRRICKPLIETLDLCVY